MCTFLVLSAVLGFFCCQIGYETDTRKMQDPNQPSIRLQDEIIGELGGPFSAIIAISDSLDAERKLARFCRSRFVGKDRVFRYMDSLSGRLDAGRPVKRLATFAGRDKRLATYLFPRGNVYNEKNLAELAEAADAIRNHLGDSQSLVVGSPLLYRHLVETLKGDLRRSLSFAAVGVALLLSVATRSILRVALALLPASLGLVWMLGGMRLCGINFSLVNAVATPLVVGIGVDDGICLISRFVSERGDVARSLVSTGRACLLTSLTTMAAFCSLLVSSNLGFVSIGISAAIGIGACLLNTLFLLSAALSTPGCRARLLR